MTTSALAAEAGHAVQMPALDGRIPLGFLASLGLLRMLDDLGAQPRLSFAEATATAIIHSPLTSLDEVAGALADAAAAAPADAAIAGIGVGFPPRPGSGGDPLRRPRGEYRELVADVQRIDPAAARWLPHLVTDLAVDQAGRAAITPVSSPAGRQTLETFFSKSLQAVRSQPTRIREALEAWRRVEGCTGEYLDAQVLSSAADDPLGRTHTERGVPGATWLATMALPLLRVTGDGQHVTATLWYRAGRRHIMLWPLWRQPLDLRAVQVLIEHPCLTPLSPPAPTASLAVAVRRAAWPRLGIIGVYGAERLRVAGQDYQRPLSPIPVQALD